MVKRERPLGQMVKRERPLGLMGIMVLKFQVKEQFAIYFLQHYGDKRTNEIFVTPSIELSGNTKIIGDKPPPPFTYSTQPPKDPVTH
jgi:hypothetical protein